MTPVDFNTFVHKIAFISDFLKSFFNSLKGQFCLYVTVLSWPRCNLYFWASNKWLHSHTHYAEWRLAALLSCRRLEIIIPTWQSKRPPASCPFFSWPVHVCPRWWRVPPHAPSCLLLVFILHDCIFNSFRALLVLASAASFTLHNQPAILQLISDVQSDSVRFFERAKSS